MAAVHYAHCPLQTLCIKKKKIKTDRQTDKQTDRQTDREREREEKKRFQHDLFKWYADRARLTRYI